MSENRRHRGPRDTKRSDWRLGRAGSIKSEPGIQGAKRSSRFTDSVFASGMAARRVETTGV